MNRMSRAGAMALCAGSLALAGLVTAGAAQAGSAGRASTVRPASVPATTSTLLALLGTPLIIDIASGPDGALTSITLTPTMVPAGTALTATKVEPDRVRFINDAGTVRVDISSRHGGQNVTARAGQLSDVVGPGSWTGDVFGDGATPTTVNFTIGELAGAPDITGITVSGGVPNLVGAVEHSTEENEQQARVAIRFTSGIQTRTLSIRVQIGNDDGESQAKVSISLSRTTGLSLPADQVIGNQTWSGLLCDGTSATIAYMVDAEGNISGVTPSPEATMEPQSGKGVSVSFSDHEQIRIRVISHEQDGTMQVSVKEKIRCESSDPTLNVPTANPTQDDNGSDDQGDDNGGDQTDDNGHDKSHDKSHDDESSSTSSTVDDSSDDSSSDDTEDLESDSDSDDSSGSTQSGSDHG